MRLFIGLGTAFSLIGCIEKTEMENTSLYCDENPENNLIEDDQDCDDILAENDCDDNDPNVTFEDYYSVTTVTILHTDGTTYDDIFTYNEEGQLLIYESIDPDGSVSYGYYYEFDDDGNILTDQEYIYGSFRTTTYTYNQNGDIQTLNYDGDGDGIFEVEHIYTYDQNGRLQEIEYFENSVLQHEKICSYDGTNPSCLLEIGSTFTLEVFDSNGLLISYQSYREGVDWYDGTSYPWVEDDVWYYTYDANGNLIQESIDGNNDGSINQEYNYTYNSDGLLIYFESYSGSSLLYFEEYSYNSNGDLLEYQTTSSNGSLNWYEINTYDANGNILTKEENGAHTGSETVYYTYIYDSNNILDFVEVTGSYWYYNRTEYHSIEEFYECE